jgi:hypothetical protein
MGRKTAKQLEADYQAQLIQRLTILFPGCHIVINDPQITQGIPDLLILFRNHWAMLEVKPSADAKLQPNQDYYVDWFDNMSFAAFIYPENEEDVLHDLQQAFSPAPSARVAVR